MGADHHVAAPKPRADTHRRRRLIAWMHSSFFDGPSAELRRMHSTATFEELNLRLTTSELATFRLSFGEGDWLGEAQFRHFASNWGRAFEHAFWKFGSALCRRERDGEPCHVVKISMRQSSLTAMYAAAIANGVHSEDFMVSLGMELVAFQRLSAQGV